MPTAQGMALLRTQKSQVGGDAGNQLWGAFGGAYAEDAQKKKSDDDDSSENSDDDDTAARGKLELMTVWKPSVAEKRQHTRHGTKGSSSDLASSNADDQPTGTRASTGTHGEELDEFAEAQKAHRFIINPDSGVRIGWDLSSLFMVVYDVIMLPMAVFEIPANPFLAMMDWATRLFWTFDMGWSCCTGVVLSDGTVEYN